MHKPTLVYTGPSTDPDTTFSKKVTDFIMSLTSPVPCIKNCGKQVTKECNEDQCYVCKPPEWSSPFFYVCSCGLMAYGDTCNKCHRPNPDIKSSPSTKTSTKSNTKISTKSSTESSTESNTKTSTKSNTESSTESVNYLTRSYRGFTCGICHKSYGYRSRSMTIGKFHGYTACDNCTVYMTYSREDLEKRRLLFRQINAENYQKKFEILIVPCPRNCGKRAYRYSNQGQCYICRPPEWSFFGIHVCSCGLLASQEDQCMQCRPLTDEELLARMRSFGWYGYPRTVSSVTTNSSQNTKTQGMEL